ncbi:hypothetical protein AB0K23_18995 [Streptomyces sp. NPDC049602]|uniref:hypothetical protein n=1 Tax=Streptomyces sp. NPDC049602 TaxID=3155504 RepID=UPI0034349DBC
MTIEPRTAVAAAIVVHDERVLLVRRRVAEGALWHGLFGSEQNHLDRALLS